jgi:hypothetical protein
MTATQIEPRNGTHLPPLVTEEPTIFQALGRVMSAVRSVGKTGHNADQNYNFRGIDAVVNAVGPQLREHGVIVVPEVQDASYRDVTTSRGKPSREVTVKVRYRFYGPAGDYIDAVTVGESMDFGDKGTPKAMSVAFRVALLQALCLPTDEQDPDAQSYERAYRDEKTDWPEAAKPSGPTAEQVAAYDLAAKKVAAVESQAALKAVWAEILADNKSGVLHNDHGEPLTQARNERFAELGGSAA